MQSHRSNRLKIQRTASTEVILSDHDPDLGNFFIAINWAGGIKRRACWSPACSSFLLSFH